MKLLVELDVVPKDGSLSPGPVALIVANAQDILAETKYDGEIPWRVTAVRLVRIVEV